MIEEIDRFKRESTELGQNARTVSRTLDSYLHEDKMMSLDLVVQAWSMGEITSEQERGLLEAVRSGIGLAGCGDTPQFLSGDPEAVSLLTLPTSNTAIKTETDRAAGKTGCLYNGPTRIVLNSSGTMTVTSPFTTSSTYAACVGTNVPLPTKA